MLAVEFDADESVDARSLRAFLPLKAGDVLTQDALDRSTKFLKWKDVWSRVQPHVIAEDGGVRVAFELEIKRTVASVTRAALPFP